MKVTSSFFNSLALVVILPLVFAGCLGPRGNDKIKTGTTEPITIKIWRTFESEEVFKPMIDLFEDNNPNIRIEYKQLDPEEYELITSEALAAGQGPDIWSIRNDWLPRHKDKLVPMPEKLLAAGPTDKNDEELVNDIFASVVSQDVVIDGRVYGLPFYMDTIVVYRNIELFRNKIRELENAGRFDEARFLEQNFNTWDKLERAVKLLTEKDAKGNITISGLAAGLSNNIRIAEDVVYAMMLQNGTEMIAPARTNASFHLSQKNELGQDIFLGTEALTRFTSYADPKSDHYSWNKSMPQDVQAFIDGKVAMIFGYQYFELLFSQIAPTFQYKVMPFPQVRDEVKATDYAQYWVETVTKNASRPDVAWRVLKELVLSQGSAFTVGTGRPGPWASTDIPSVLDRVSANNPFTFQPQTAMSWYKTKRPDKVDKAFRDMIQKVGIKTQSPQNAIEEAARQVSKILQATEP